MAVEWRRLSDLADKGVDFYVCCRCGNPSTFEDCWTTVPFAVGGKQMMQGYIHCDECRRSIDPMTAWKQAHDREYAD